MALDWKNAYAKMQAGGEAAFPPACLHYVLQLCRSPRPNSGSVLTPEEFTGLFRKQAKRDFGSLMASVLEDWGLQSPQDLGKAVVLLGRYGCLSLEPTDTVESFSALGSQL